jgi:hypothetical protein
MFYAILCYDSEEVVGAWTPAQDQAVMMQLGAVCDRLAKAGKLGPVARLMPTKTARTLRKGQDTRVVYGPFAETKEVLLGLFIVDCESDDDAIQAARALAAASGSEGAYEIRPLLQYQGAP